MSLLTICQNAAIRLGLPKPLNVIGSSDENTRRLLAVAQEEGQDLAYRTDWNKLVLEANFTTDGSSSYDLSVIAPAYDYMVNSVIWNRTDREPVVYINPDNYQQEKAWGVLTVNNKFRFVGGALILEPAVASSQNLVFEYMSRAFCKSASGTAQTSWLADTDIGVLDEEVMTLGVIWRFRRLIGFDFAPDLSTYERRVQFSLGRDKALPTINMNGIYTTAGKVTYNLPDIGFGV
jgi:hypothetical protein